MIDKKVAEHIKSISLTCVAQLDSSVKDAIEGAPEEHSSMYRRLVGQVLGQLFTDILMPIYAAHPDLEPEELKRARHAPKPIFMPPEIAAKLVSAVSAAAHALSNLRADLAREPREHVGNLYSALQEPLDTLQMIEEFLRRACPEVKET